MAKSYPLGVARITKLVESVATQYCFYLEKDFVIAYVYWLLTSVPDWMERIALGQQKIKILLLSSLSPTAENYLAMQIKKTIYGSFEIIEGNQEEKAIWDSFDAYDLILTTEDLKMSNATPVLHIDSYLSWQNTFLIQEKVSELIEKKEVNSSMS